MYTRLFLFIILPITLFVSTVDIFFSTQEMDDMGIHLEYLAVGE